MRTYTYSDNGKEVSLERDNIRVLYAWGDNEQVCIDIAACWLSGFSIQEIIDEHSYDAMIEDDPFELSRMDYYRNFLGGDRYKESLLNLREKS